MNKDNAHLYLPLVQAMADGKTIQMSDEGGKEWTNMTSIALNENPARYRVKPEPREWEAIVGNDGNLYRPGECVMPFRQFSIRVREILD